MSTPQLEFAYCELAIAGTRPYQEDTTRVWRPNSSSARNRPLLAVLADGMGGHVSGEVASRLATEQYVHAFSSEHGSVDQRLEHALHAGNDAILNAIRREKNLNGMGCTLVAGYIDQDGLRWASVGDSLLLLFRDRVLLRKNESHSLGALLDQHAEANVISEDEAKNSPRRHTLRSALTGAPIPLMQIETEAHPLQSGDWIVMASDGLETLSGDEIARIISEHENAQPNVVAKALLDEVSSAGLANQDNTTVVVIRVSDPTRETTRIISHEPGQAKAATGGGLSPTLAAIVGAAVIALTAGWLLLGSDGLQSALGLGPAAQSDASKADKQDAVPAKKTESADKPGAKPPAANRAAATGGEKVDDGRKKQGDAAAANKPADEKDAASSPEKPAKPTAADNRAPEGQAATTGPAPPAQAPRPPE